MASRTACGSSGSRLGRRVVPRMLGRAHRVPSLAPVGVGFVAVIVRDPVAHVRLPHLALVVRRVLRVRRALGAQMVGGAALRQPVAERHEPLE